MVQLRYEILRLRKRVPLTISRGTSSDSPLIWIRLEQDGVEGWGEAGEFSIGTLCQSLEDLVDGIEKARPIVESFDLSAREGLEAALVKAGICSAVRAGVMQAAFDWWGRSLRQPVWKLLGLSSQGAPATSVTVGISTPEAAAVRVQQWLELADVRAFKVKLGSPDGVDADQRMLEAVRATIPHGSKLSVDANGGWQPEAAAALIPWLADRGVDHVEQPLPRGQESELAKLHERSVLPLIADESCFYSRDIPGLAGRVDGINVKLMKCGGVAEALRMIHTARAHGLRVMLGCYGQSGLANAAAASLGSLVDYVDLDSHLNLVEDPFRGLELVRGCLQVSEAPGFGMTHDSVH